MWLSSFAASGSLPALEWLFEARIFQQQPTAAGDAVRVVVAQPGAWALFDNWGLDPNTCYHTSCTLPLQ